MVQLLCPFKSERGLVQRWTLSESIPGRSLLGWVQRRSLFSEKSGHDDPAEPKHLPLGLSGDIHIWLNQNTWPALNQRIWQQTTETDLQHQESDVGPPYALQCYSVFCRIFPFILSKTVRLLLRSCIEYTVFDKTRTLVTVTKTEKPVIYNSNISSFEVRLLKDMYIYLACI